MRVHDLLDAIDRAHSRLELKAGHLRYIGPVEHAEHVARHRDLLIAHVGGAAGGHALGICTVCCEPSLVHVDRTPPDCRMTPRCTGKHTVRTADVERLAVAGHRPAPKGTRLPARPEHARLLGERPTFPPLGPRRAS